MWICCQIGAREHYAIPRVLHRGGRLATLYTDVWAGPLTRSVARGSGSALGRSFAARCHPELPDAHVKSWNARSLVGEARVRRRKNDQVYEHFVETGAAFAVRVREALKRRTDLNSDSILFAYDTGALETFEWCRDCGLKCVLNQMDPNRLEVKLVQEEEKRWPDWPLRTVEVPEAYFCRREREWALADMVVVNSDYCREALVAQGVPAEKLAVIPLCYEAEGTTRLQDNTTPGPAEVSSPWSVVRGQQSGLQSPVSALRSPPSALRPLKVLFLGQVILRKGIQYLMQAAKLLESENIQFDVVGPGGISNRAVASAPRNLVFHGRATRDQTAHWYRQSDLFVLPTLSDGFALTQLEAMSHGLPVVATPCCGAVVTDGADGFIVPPRDGDALAKIFQRYLTSPGLIQDQRTAAFAKVRQFTLERLADNLSRLESRLLTT